MENSQMIAIIDDSLKDGERLKLIFQRVFPDFIIEVFNSIDDCIVSGNHYVLCSLDIYLNQESGLDLTKREKIDAEYFIYFSCVDDKMQKAFGKNVLGYFLKTDSDEELQKQLAEKVYSYLKTNVQFKIKEGILRIPVSKIYKISFERRQLFLYTDLNRYRIYDLNLSMCYQMLSEEMLQIDKSILVNRKHIKNIQGNIIYFDNGTTERISYRRVKEVTLEFIRGIIQ